ncbi:MAG: TonB-dependent receptor [Parvularcula sp.]
MTHKTLFAGSALLALAIAAPTVAQDDLDALTDEILVTGTKRPDGENLQDVKAAMTALGAERIEALQIRDVRGAAFKMPNVSLVDIATAKGTANFTIRGLGVNSSIPSIDPAVGVFVDGVYLGVNTGVVFDTFDLQSIEVLRGPQGVLFGRNVTGGAVLVNTQDPSEEFGAKLKLAADSGLRGTGANYTAAASVTGSMVEDRVSGKLSIYYNDDQGWFKNYLGGPTNGQPDAFQDFGASETFIIRPALKITPSDGTSIVLKYEHGESTGDGPAGQSHTNGSGVPGAYGNFDRDEFGLSVNTEGFNDSEWDQISARVDWDVAFGDGTVTNIFGWRQYEQTGLSDIDSSSRPLFHAPLAIEQDQTSNELRYAGRFNDNLDVTAGVFYFTQDLAYSEQRILLGGALTQAGGGVQDHETFGIFVSGDMEVSERMSLNAGLRYTDETKDVQIASLIANINSPCNVVKGECPFDFTDRFSTNNWSPKVGFGYELSDTARIYGSWSRAFRAGGFNFRNTATDTVNLGPGPFQDEQVDSFEIGIKSEPAPGARLNAAAFYTDISDMQREINLADPNSGVVQLIRNTADAEIYGVEVEGQARVSDHVVIDGSLGLVEGNYQKILFDLTGDGVVNSADLNLDIPRLMPVTGHIGAVYQRPLADMGDFSARVNYAYNDKAAYTDNNLGTLNSLRRLDASFSLANIGDSKASVTLYGKNLLNEVQHGNDTQLPSLLGPVPLGGTFAPLQKGRVVGVELNFEM